MRGFEYLAYSAVSAVLLLVLVLLPLAPALASEEVLEGASVEAEVIVERPAESEEEVLVEPEAVTEEPETAETVDGSTAGTPVADESATTLPDEREAEEEPEGDTGDAPATLVELLPLESETPQGDSSAHGDTETSEEISAGETENVEGEPGEDGGSLPTETEGAGATSTEEVSEPTEDETPELGGEEQVSEVVPEVEETVLETEDASPVDETATGTEEEVTETVPTENLVVVAEVPEDGSKLSFMKEECISVGDGSFYCTEATSTPLTLGADRVFSATDADGDKEIYIEREGELIPVTKNLFDDDAPYYDERSESIVWHRLIDGRYQIVSYDTETGEERVLTNDRYNNMEPSRYDEVTVWQGWIGNDWEIMLMEGSEISMLTDNTYPDVAPNVNGAYIVWQAFEAGAWRVKVYDTITEEVTTIDDAEGASVENPRFVLVYDSKHENGDVETRGFDLEKKEAVPLSAEPAKVPESIPDPDQTGEDRALVQTVVQLKPKNEGEEDVPDGLGDVAGTTTPNGTEVEDLATDIVIPPFTGGTDVDESMVVAGDTGTSTSHIEDVVISGEVIESPMAPTDHIEDVIVTPFVEPIEPEVL